MYEVHLRNSFYYPGSFFRYFTRVDSLILDEEMIVDSDGIQTANPEYYRHNETFIKDGYRINDDGFRSDAFKPKSERDSTKTAILFLGDSHTWGASAEPITECFVDIIKRAGYITFNTGIPGADPSQYWAIAKKYLPKLQPDICYLMFDGSNDLMWFKRDPLPHVPLDYWTNAGIIEARKSAWIPDSEGVPFSSAQEAYDYFINTYTLYGDNVSFLGKLCAKTVITTNIYKYFALRHDPKLKVKRPKTPWADYYIDKIDSLCKSYQVPFFVIVIPDINKFITDPAGYKQAAPKGLFEHRKILMAPGIEKSDYRPGEGHFNNIGHKKMAKFILNHIQQTLHGKD